MGKFGEGIKKAGELAVSAYQQDRQRRAEEAEKRLAKETKRAEKQQRKAATLRTKCVFIGSTQQIPGLVRDKEYPLTLDADGLRVGKNAKGDPMLTMWWPQVTDVQVADASRTAIGSSVSHYQSGGLTDIFHTSPATKVYSKFVGQSYLSISTESVGVVLRVPEAGNDLEGRLLLTASKRKHTPTEAPASPQLDPIEQLKKLGELRDAGVLTDEEFAAKKAEVLARM